ncbi:uncharacterized protein LOC134582747 [Pelobates fuscus]|uniref:uncharacterized protein LOC134582747 n=1 Tax=Pelobates fuscus TaxID=191477 RepID=UPI002FE43279
MASTRCYKFDKGRDGGAARDQYALRRTSSPRYRSRSRSASAVARHRIGSPVGGSLTDAAHPGRGTVHNAAPGASGTRGLAGRVAWIVGYSFVFWAAARAQGQQLGFHRDQLAVQWFGYRGFCWGEVCGMVFRMVAGGHRPDLLVLHAGGNDLGLTPQRRLVKWMKQDLNSLRDLLPGVMLVWSEIVPRRRWRHARDPEAIDRCRKKVNSLMASFVRKLGGWPEAYPVLKATTKVTASKLLKKLICYSALSPEDNNA